MRRWSLHPRYLDAKGLVALWREALLAQSVLQGKTKGYTNHPQLQRFQESKDPVDAIGAYLCFVHAESCNRGYCFTLEKIACPVEVKKTMSVTKGQMEYEWEHLLAKLMKPAPDFYKSALTVSQLDRIRSSTSCRAAKRTGKNRLSGRPRWRGGR